MNTEDILHIARLMGWEEITPGNWTDVGVYWIVRFVDGEREVDTAVDDNSLFAPHEKAGHADLILDHIAALGWAVTTFTSGWGGKRMIRCCIMRSPNGPAVDVVAETRPLAICRAFVQAMERWEDEV